MDTLPRYTPIPCTPHLYLRHNAGKPAYLLFRHTVIGLHRRHDPILSSCLSDKEQSARRLAGNLSFCPHKKNWTDAPLGRKDWVVPCGTDDSGRNRTAQPFTSRILYNEDGQLFHRLATPTDCPTCQDGSQHGAAASPWNGINVNELYERPAVHFGNDAKRACRLQINMIGKRPKTLQMEIGSNAS